jgi:hypothetical protein
MTDTDIVCPRCGEPNRHWARFCWICGNAIATAVAPAGRKPKSVLAIILTVVAITMGLVALIPVLLIVTCFGIAFLGGMKF